MVGDARSGGTEVPVRAGVGFVSQELSSEPVGSVGHRKSVVDKVSQLQNEELEVKVVWQSIQGAWMIWCNISVGMSHGNMHLQQIQSF